MNYFVCRSYSHTDKQHLIKVMSRRFEDVAQANDYRDTLKAMSKNKRYTFFVILTKEETLP